MLDDVSPLALVAVRRPTRMRCGYGEAFVRTRICSGFTAEQPDELRKLKPTMPNELAKDSLLIAVDEI
jgi:hypothetical protein